MFIVGDDVMFDNLTTEIILLAVVPVVIIGIIDLIAFFIIKRTYRNYRFNYFFKLSSIIAISFVLPLIAGYTIWVFTAFQKRSLLGSNLLYLLLIIFLWIFLFVLLIVLYKKTKENALEDEKIDKIVEKNPKIKIWEIDKDDMKENSDIDE